MAANAEFQHVLTQFYFWPKLVPKQLFCSKSGEGVASVAAFYLFFEKGQSFAVPAMHPYRCREEHRLNLKGRLTIEFGRQH